MQFKFEVLREGEGLMDEKGALTIQKFYEVLGYGFPTGRECYVCAGNSLPPPDRSAQWVEDSNFNEAAELQRHSSLMHVLKTARREGRVIVLHGGI